MLPTTPDVVLDVRNFSLRFSASESMPNLIDNLSLTVARGQTLCVVGESGCGKSVTSMALMGLLPPAARIVSGSARFEDKDLFTCGERALADVRGNRMSMIFQEPMTSLNPAFTVGAQIAEGIRRHRRVSKEAARAGALEMLRRVRIPAPEKRLDAYPHQLSGGMRQRVMIAMALANRPSLLIADEPTTALDVTIQAEVLSLIRALQQETGTAMVLITHDLGVVAEVADYVAVMYAGRVVEYGPADVIYDDPQHPYTIGLMGAIPSIGKRAGRLATISGSVPAPEHMPAGCRFAPRCPFSEARCVETAPPEQVVEGEHRVSCWRAPIEMAVDMPAEMQAGMGVEQHVDKHLGSAA
jgi:peptide/nickel transport system ATP-binding protein